jgi:hypothetical protein
VLYRNRVVHEYRYTYRAALFQRFCTDDSSLVLGVILQCREAQPERSAMWARVMRVKDDSVVEGAMKSKSGEHVLSDPQIRGLRPPGPRVAGLPLESSR